MAEETRTFVLSGSKRAVEATIRRMALECAVTDIGTQRVRGPVEKPFWGKASARIQVTGTSEGLASWRAQASTTATVEEAK